MNIYTFVILALVVESVWETVKNIFQYKSKCIDKIACMIIAAGVVFTSNIDILSFVGIETKFNVGKIFTIILISRGSNFVHNLLGIINKEYQLKK